MRIVIDMQGAQTASRFRGIGRYTLGFTKAVARNRGEHEIILALSGLFPETIEPIRAAFNGLLPQENIRVWYAPGPVFESVPGNDARREAAELIREAFLASLQPDIVHLCSLFEGYFDDAVTSIRRFDVQTPVTVTFYDLIPLLNPHRYLKPNPSYAKHYEKKIQYLKRAEGYLAISDFTRSEALRHLNLSDETVINVSTAIEPPQSKILSGHAIGQKFIQKVRITRPFVLYVGATDERKNLPRLIQAYADLSKDIKNSYQLVFAGGIAADHQIKLTRLAKERGLGHDELIFTQYASDEEITYLYKHCKLFIFPSWHEGFGLPALEAMACGAPVIGANASSLPEVIGNNDALFDPFDVAAITAKMHQVLVDEDFQEALRTHSKEQVKKFSWDATAKRALAAWRSILSSAQPDYFSQSMADTMLSESLTPLIVHQADQDHLSLAVDLALNHPKDNPRQLLVDISELVQRDAKSGIQRVVRNVLREWLSNPPEGLCVEPVYAMGNQPYRYARQFIAQFLGTTTDGIIDELIDYAAGDVFFGLDFLPPMQVAHADFYQELRRHGVVVKFMVYDLLCMQQPKHFVAGAAENFHAWLNVVGESDGAVCISQSVANELERWMGGKSWQRQRSFSNDWFHLGADMQEHIVTSEGLSADGQNTVEHLKSKSSFLMVGTLEPRKGHAQVLSAFEELWREDVSVNLVIVGKQGWLVDELVARLRSHPKLNQSLFWLEAINDQYLDAVYAVSTCLIAASYGEGFGLPLIEAAQHNLPIIARDISVFREVAGEHAYYFNGKTPEELADAIQDWLLLFEKQEHARSNDITWMTWKESSQKLLELIQLSCHQINFE